MKFKRHLLPILFLIFALVLAGCSKSEDKAADTNRITDSDTSLSSKTDDSSSPALKPESKESGSDSKTFSDVTSPAATYGDTSEPAESKVSADSEALKDISSDTILSETKFSIKEAAGSSDYGDLSLGRTESTGDYISSEYGTALDDGRYDDSDVIIVDPKDPEPVIIDPEPRIQPSAGTLTAGEWNDNRNFDFLKKLISNGQDFDYKTFFTQWELSPFNRLVITVNDDSASPVQGASITVEDGQGNSIWKGITDHTGTVYAYYGLLDADMMPSKVTAEYNGTSVNYDVQNDDLLDTSTISLTLNGERKLKTLDLMFTVDTTGSMGDEIYYLQTELQDVIKRVENDTANIPLRLSVNFYKDHGDEYIVRPYEFSTNVNEQLAYLNKEYASGGGDFEEAVELALESSVNDHTWNADSIKLLFLVLDAPSHNTPEIRESLKTTISKASEMGIRIIPVASSGIDKDTEFILRAFAMATGGTYTFLTDDSGVGGSHIEPTVGEYTVEHLNDLLVRIIEEYIG